MLVLVALVTPTETSPPEPATNCVLADVPNPLAWTVTLPPARTPAPWPSVADVVPIACEVAVAVGLAQNLGALRALSTEGIQRGHMALHARNIALVAGATGEEIDRIARQMAQEHDVRVDRALVLLAEIRG